MGVGSSWLTMLQERKLWQVCGDIQTRCLPLTADLVEFHGHKKQFACLQLTILQECKSDRQHVHDRVSCITEHVALLSI